IATVFRTWRNRLVCKPALNQASPFHVVEEESSCPLRVIDFAQSDRPAHVESENIQAQLGDFLRSWIEIVASIERVVPIELPGGGVKCFRARLQDHGHGSSR